MKILTINIKTLRQDAITHRFYYYLDMARLTDQEKNAIKKIVICTDPKRRGHIIPCEGCTQRSSRLVRWRWEWDGKSSGEMRARDLTVVSVGRDGQSTISRSMIG